MVAVQQRKAEEGRQAGLGASAEVAGKPRPEEGEHHMALWG